MDDTIHPTDIIDLAWHLSLNQTVYWDIVCLEYGLFACTEPRLKPTQPIKVMLKRCPLFRLITAELDLSHAKYIATLHITYQSFLLLPTYLYIVINFLTVKRRGNSGRQDISRHGIHLLLVYDSIRNFSHLTAPRNAQLQTINRKKLDEFIYTFTKLVHPTPILVVLEHTYALAHVSPYHCWFLKQGSTTYSHFHHVHVLHNRLKKHTFCSYSSILVMTLPGWVDISSW